MSNHFDLVLTTRLLRICLSFPSVLAPFCNEEDGIGHDIVLSFQQIMIIGTSDYDVTRLETEANSIETKLISLDVSSQYMESYLFLHVMMSLLFLNF